MSTTSSDDPVEAAIAAAEPKKNKGGNPNWVRFDEEEKKKVIASYRDNASWRDRLERVLPDGQAAGEFVRAATRRAIEDLEPEPA